MRKTYKINNIPVEILIKQAKAWGVSWAKDTIYIQILAIKEKNKNIKNFILLKKLDFLLNSTSEKELYKIMLTELKKIPLEDLEEYKALKEFLEGVADTGH